MCHSSLSFVALLAVAINCFYYCDQDWMVASAFFVTTGVRNEAATTATKAFAYYNCFKAVAVTS